MNEKYFEHCENPIKKASFWSKVTYSWIQPLLKLGRKKEQLELSDLYSPLPEDEATKLTDELENKWNEEIKEQKNPNLGRVLVKLYWKKFC